MGGAFALPLWAIDTQVQSEEEEGTAVPSAPLLEVAEREPSLARRRAATHAEIAPLSPVRLFALLRQSVPLPPRARGPDSLLVPVPHLLN